MKEKKKLSKGQRLIVALILIAAFIFIIAALASLGGGMDGAKEPATDANGQAVTTTITTKASRAQTTKTTKAPAQSILAINETIQASGLSFNAREIKRHPGTTFVRPSEEGKVFIGVRFIVENLSSENKSVAYLGPLFDSYADNIKCLLAPMGQSLYGVALNGDLAPGMKMEGYHVIEAPASAKTLTLELGALYRDSANMKLVLEIPQ